MIQPTIGRVVLFRYNKDQVQPYPALVCYVHGDRMINVAGFDQNGTPFSQPSTPLLQDDDPVPENGLYAEWMPYQKEVAAKEAAQVAPAPTASSIKPL
jgi:hypothetical protein